MMKHEFEKLVNCEISDDEYTKIEIVYMYYPTADEVTKHDIANLFKIGGMLLISDLLERALKIQMIEEKLKNVSLKLMSLKVYNE